jgi:acyl-CoA thioesterase YciA
MQIAEGRVATVAINSKALLTPVHVGAVVSCYTDVIEVGRSSIRINVEVWIKHKVNFTPIKVTEGEFVVVSLNSKGRPQSIPGQ